MAAPDNWIAHLKAIIKAHIAVGMTPREAYRKIATEAELHEEYVYQVYKGYKTSIGKDAAVKLSEAYANGRPLDWIDRPVPGMGEPQPRLMSDSDWQFLQDLQRAPPEEEAAVKTSYRLRAENAEKEAQAVSTANGASRVITDEQVRSRLLKNGTPPNGQMLGGDSQMGGLDETKPPAKPSKRGGKK